MTQNRILQGIPASPGIVVGRVQVLTEAAQISTRTLYTAKDVAEEQEWFKEVVEQIEAELTRLKDEISEDLKEHAHILELHLLILRERMLYAETLRLIQEENLNAERALHQAYLKIKELFQRIGDKHIRGRLADVETVYRRLMGRLSGKDSSKPFSFPEPAIIVARDLSPAETTQMSPAQVLGFITERGGKTSHTAIIAHSLEIPAVVGLDNATLEMATGDLIILDGVTGVVILDPDDALRRIYQARRADFEIFKSEVVLGCAMAATTRDGLPTRVLANIEMPEEVSLASKYGADGVGLYRTEFLYLRQRHLPTEEELFQDYRQVVEAMAPQEVTIRTLDIGGDKFLSHLEYAPEMNPALGLRAIRFCLKEQKIFRTQLKAILRASAFGQVRVMFPLISSPREMQEGRKLLEEVKAELKKEKVRLRRQTAGGGHDRGAGGRDPGGFADPLRRFLQHRHQRPDSIRPGHRPGQPAGGGHVPAAASRGAAHGAGRSAGRPPGRHLRGHVRRDGRRSPLHPGAPGPGGGRILHERHGHSGGQTGHPHDRPGGGPEDRQTGPEPGYGGRSQ